MSDDTRELVYKLTDALEYARDGNIEESGQELIEVADNFGGPALAAGAIWVWSTALIAWVTHLNHGVPPISLKFNNIELNGNDITEENVFWSENVLNAVLKYDDEEVIRLGNVVVDASDYGKITCLLRLTALSFDSRVKITLSRQAADLN